MDQLKDDPSLTAILKPEDEYKPEVAIFMNSPGTDSDGLCHFIQLHPDGEADYVGFSPELMDHPTRWIMRTGEQEALGIALPSTCDPEGYTAEKRKGNIKQIAGGASLSLAVKTGVLDGDGLLRKGTDALLNIKLEKKMKVEGTLIKHTREEAIQLAYDLGHLYELGAHYCPQASLAALMDVFHIRDDTLFKSVFGFHGGSGNSGIGPCGALAGGITAIGYLYGRSRPEFDMRVENCTATPLVKKLVDRFSGEFEGIRCRDCQKKMFGREIDFSKEEDLRFFEENEGHQKCAQVVGKGAALAAEILWDALHGDE